MKKLFLFIVLSFLVIGFNGCSGDDDPEPVDQRSVGKISSASPNFSLYNSKHVINRDATKYDFQTNTFHLHSTDGYYLTIKIHDLKAGLSTDEKLYYTCSEVSWGDYSTKNTPSGGGLSELYLDKINDVFHIGSMRLFTSDQKGIFSYDGISFYK